jgi:hypothetical protein
MYILYNIYYIYIYNIYIIYIKALQKRDNLYHDGGTCQKYAMNAFVKALSSLPKPSISKVRLYIYIYYIYF